jgi:hypothetical protein
VGERSGEPLWGIQPRMRSSLSCSSLPTAVTEWSNDDAKFVKCNYRVGHICAVAVGESVLK